MKIRKSVAVLALVLALPALADVKVVKKTTNTPAGMGGTPQEQTSTTWIGDGRLAEIGEGRKTVIDLNAKKVLIVDESAKTYNVVDLPIDFAKLAPGMEQMIEQFMSQLQMKIDVIPTDERREINGFPAVKYTLAVSSAMGIQSEMTLWLTKEIDIDFDQWGRMSREMGSLAPPGVGELFKKMSELDGFPVLQEMKMTMMGNTVESREEVVSVERLAAPEGTYGAPADFTEEPFNPMGVMAGGR